MNFTLRKIPALSGEKASIYTVFISNEEQSLFDQFLEESVELNHNEAENIVERLYSIGHDVGAREQYFKIEEGKPGDLVCALYDDPDSKLRLYGIRFGQTMVILGGGGPKSKKIRAWQQDTNLSKHAQLMMAVSKAIYERIKDKEIRWNPNQRDLEGDLNFVDEGDQDD